jgi:hypothetical protein
MAKTPSVRKHPDKAFDVRQRAAWILLRPSYLTFLRELKGEPRSGLAAQKEWGALVRNWSSVAKQHSKIPFYNFFVDWLILCRSVFAKLLDLLGRF